MFDSKIARRFAVSSRYIKQRVVTCMNNSRSLRVDKTQQMSSEKCFLRLYLGVGLEHLNFNHQTDKS